MTVGTSLKQLFQLCSGKYLKSEPSKFEAINKVCLRWLCQDDLTEKGDVEGRGDTDPQGGSQGGRPWRATRLGLQVELDGVMVGG